MNRERANHFECDAHDPHGFRVKLFAAEKWCDWHAPHRVISASHQMRTSNPSTNRVSTVAANQRELKRLGSHARHNGVSGEAVAVETI